MITCDLIDKPFRKLYRVMKMKKIVSIVFLTAALFVFPANNAHASESDVLREIKNLHEDMDKRFEGMQVQMDKRFEQVDKRFDQILWFIGLWIPLSMAVVGYILQRLNKHDDRFFDISHKALEAEHIIPAIRKARPDTKKGR
jgi:hypothetical protein